MRGAPKWTPEQDSDLRRLIDLGRSFSAAAEQINADYATTFSRNAAIGRAHRLGIKTERRGMPGAGRKPTGRKPRPAKPVFPKQIVIRAPEPVIEPAPFIGSLNLPFGDLRPFSTDRVNQCRFIEGASPDFLCCGTETLPGASWCGHHHEITHTQDTSQRFKVVGGRRGMNATNFSRSVEAA
ncbi:GcrA family cell cycle regulator [Tardiphaga sp. 866_E4_N2_3]